MRRLQRDRMTGRIYAVSGGAPNQPLVCLVANCFWSLDEDSGFEWLEPQILTVTDAYFATKDHRALTGWIKQNRTAWRDGHSARKSLPVSVMIDVSQSPAALALMGSLEEAQTAVEAVKLTAGDDDPISRRRLVQSGTAACGARFLMSWFDGKIAKAEPEGHRCGRPHSPGRIIISFDQFNDAGPPGMTRQELRAAMSAADNLVKRSGNAADTEALMSLNADECVAAAAMFLMLAAETMSPALAYQPDTALGYGDITDEERTALEALFALP